MCLAKTYNPYIEGWINYYGHFYRTQLRPTLKRIDVYVIRWSPAADAPGSRNLIGIKNGAIDALIDRMVFARSRAELVAATKALDRVLLWNHYVVPQWTTDKLRIARWDRFSRPETMPKYGIDAFPATWWWDARRAANTA